MKHFLTHTTDVHGSKYIVIKFDENTDKALSKFLSDFKNFIGDYKFDIMTGNQQDRDIRDGHTHTHHTTVINVMDLKKVADSKEVGKIMSYSIDDFKMIGLGTAIDDKKGNQSFFVVCQSDTLDVLRKKLDLNPIDFHITLGFADKDVFGKNKGLNSLIDV